MQPGADRLTLGAVQPRIPADTLLLEYWSAANASALVWISSSASGLVRQAASADDVKSLQRVAGVLSRVGDDWQTASLQAGRILLSGLPGDDIVKGVTGLLVVPDGPLHAIPFEALTVPGSRDLPVERFRSPTCRRRRFSARAAGRP